MVKVMYPIECCVDLAAENQRWHDDLAHDPPYAQSVFEIARVHFDIVRSRDQQLQKLVHMSNSLGPLRKQLASSDVVVTDSMVFVVVALALVSEAFDELDDALMHLRGLHTMIKLRGGLAALAHKRSLQIKCCRVDLALTMRTGEKPLLFSVDSLMWKPYLADTAKTPMVPWHTLVDNPDIRLVNVWLDLRDFIISVNLAHQTKRKISPVLFQEVLISVQYRLHNLAYSSHDRQETLRLAMVALSASLFLGVHSLHSRPMHCKRLEGALGASLRAFDETGGKAYLELNLWLIFLGKMSGLDLPEDRPCLEQNLLKTTRALRLTTWVEVRLVLKGFLWVDIFHDDAGERIFISAKSAEITSPG
ncbi:hypothetical protein CONLIGDRAFT_636319 [Coniochaeta ligniaria NRRL 30616]|uniref:Transcription factor domain-containing protein n=1 Tax=Coniochaeta ligniaria NRRL 30616 TaxID=1408157 RepID=A0A1J7ICT8_9PEZI|nr:hypothetical protein CONLIGDRAFT_636319 [Coniochaeta ligniaria NRRL 30616]